jgi:hypothetical protein
LRSFSAHPAKFFASGRGIRGIFADPMLACSLHLSLVLVTPQGGNSNMSPSIAGTGSSASRRSFGAGSAADGSGNEAGRGQGQGQGTVRSDAARNGSAGELLEPHWQASIESATD